MMENIIYRDLPSLVDVYTKLPLEYRNEYCLKNGKTHRQLLVENIEILAKKLKQLEHESYESLNQTLTVKSRLIKEKYCNDTSYISLQNTESQLEVEKIDSTYNWSKEKSNFINVDQAAFKKTYIKDNKKGFTIKNGKIKESLNCQLKYISQKSWRNIKKLFNNQDMKIFFKEVGSFSEALIGWVLFIMMLISPITIPISILFYNSTFENSGRDIENISQMLINNNGDQNLKNIILKTIEKYAQKNDMTVVYNQKVHKLLVSQKLSSRQCEGVFSYINKNHSSDNWNFTVNGANYSSNMSISTTNAETICDYKNNRVSITFAY